jgi:hypothetical protein
MMVRLSEHIKKRLTLSYTAIILLGLLTSFSETALAQGKQGCTCDFADPKWGAYATKAYCAIFMHKGKTACEIEFTGLSANPNLVASIVGIDWGTYRANAFETLNRYLQYLREGNRAGLADPKFLATALPTLMRGVYLRGSIDDVTVGQRVLLDKAIMEFLSKYLNDVSDVFLNKKPPFSTEVSDTRFEVNRGYIVVLDRSGDRLIALYMPAE